MIPGSVSDGGFSRCSMFEKVTWRNSNGLFRNTEIHRKLSRLWEEIRWHHSIVDLNQGTEYVFHGNTKKMWCAKCQTSCSGPRILKNKFHSIIPTPHLNIPCLLAVSTIPRLIMVSAIVIHTALITEIYTHLVWQSILRLLYTFEYLSKHNAGIH